MPPRSPLPHACISPFLSIGVSEDALADCVPDIVHQWWSPSLIPYTRGIDDSARPTFFSGANSPVPSRTAESGQSKLNSGPTMGSTTKFFTSRRFSQPRGCPPVMNLRSTSIIFNLLGSCAPSISTSTRLSPRSCWFAKSLSAHTRFPHTPFGGRSVLSCKIKDFVRVLPVASFKPNECTRTTV